MIVCNEDIVYIIGDGYSCYRRHNKKTDILFMRFAARTTAQRSRREPLPKLTSVKVASCMGARISMTRNNFTRDINIIHHRNFDWNDTINMQSNSSLLIIAKYRRG